MAWGHVPFPGMLRGLVVQAGQGLLQLRQSLGVLLSQYAPCPHGTQYGVDIHGLPPNVIGALACSVSAQA